MRLPPACSVATVVTPHHGFPSLSTLMKYNPFRNPFRHSNPNSARKGDSKVTGIMLDVRPLFTTAP